jgi:hypothetical protein
MQRLIKQLKIPGRVLGSISLHEFPRRDPATPARRADKPPMPGAERQQRHID